MITLNELPFLFACAAVMNTSVVVCRVVLKIRRLENEIADLRYAVSRLEPPRPWQPLPPKEVIPCGAPDGNGAEMCPFPELEQR